MEPIILRFTREHEFWKKTVYGENDISYPVIGKLYIDRNAMRQMGNPSRIRVTIEPDQESDKT